MIPGLVQILLFQGLGEVISRFLVPLVPGPVVGLVALLLYLLARGAVGVSLEQVAATFSQHLGLLFVPAAVGVVMFWPQLQRHALAVVVALVGSVTLTMAVTVLILKLLARGDGDAT